MVSNVLSSSFGYADALGVATDVSRARLLRSAITAHTRLEGSLLFMLGPFMFSTSTTAPSTWTRKKSFKWAPVPRVGAQDSLQYMGPGDDTLTLAGVVFSNFKGGVGQVEYMRTIAEQGKPMPMMDGNGTVWGNWCILEVSEVAESFRDDATPRKQQWTISLRAQPFRKSLLDYKTYL